ncbi:helix-turn-helix transcriptional regulator [Goodfellowiella coeruleoviolacea]|uniref:HTH domain-containing protein n=1 Tax=Goodfellowiella coeruleoviolacea TaxID=334858 RepID=A0AAE3KGH4_9PSEU|nr:WYL domain-containing protein [Goodfellowiella coeruleoviolacea]MCP2165892.1 HTH domain-containing protein [Goodfellowiella coeruleoviolacea]
MNRTERLYAIAEELRSAGGRGRTSDWLARRFEVSARTVKRDVTALQQAGVPIWAQAGPGGGYVLDTAVSLPPLNVTAAEATAVALALAALPELPFGPDGRSALAKVLAAMPARERELAGELGRRLWVHHAVPPTRPAIARVLDEALRAGVVVVLDYTDAGGAHSSKRAVEPMAVALTRGNWYLLAWCRSRRAGRWFRLDRIARVTATRERAAPRDVIRTFGEPPPDAHPLVLDEQR